MKKFIMGMVILSLFQVALANEEIENLLDEGRYQIEVGNYAAGKENLVAYLKRNSERGN